MSKAQGRFEAIHLVALAIDEVQARGTKRHPAAVKMLEAGRTLWRETQIPKCPHCGKEI